MSPEDALRTLRRIRFSPQAGRPVTLAWINRQAGYDRVSTYRAIRRGWMTQRMANRLEPALKAAENLMNDVDLANRLQTVTVLGGNIVKSSTLGRLGAGIDGRGGARTRRQAPAPGAKREDRVRTKAARGLET